MWFSWQIWIQCTNCLKKTISFSQIVNTKYDCLALNYTWKNSKISFDNVGNAYLALFQVVSLVYYLSLNAIER